MIQKKKMTFYMAGRQWEQSAWENKNQNLGSGFMLSGSLILLSASVRRVCLRKQKSNRPLLIPFAGLSPVLVLCS